MKKIILFCTAIVFSALVFAQNERTYTPLITDKNTVWKTIALGPNETFYLQGDTIIDSLKYRKIYVDYFMQGDEFQNLYVGALIEKEGKVWHKTIEGDVLLYDFNLIEGEQIRVRGIKEEDGVLLTINTIDSVKIANGEWRTRWYLDNESHGSTFNDIWIEGIGSLNGVLVPGRSQIHTSVKLLQQKQDNQLMYCNLDYADLIYGNFNKDCNALVSNTTTINNKTNFLTATPSIFNHQTQLRFSLPKSSNISLHIFNHQGQIITSLYDKEQLQMGEYQQSLNMPNVSNGIYYAVLLVNGRRVATQKLVLIK